MFVIKFASTLHGPVELELIVKISCEALLVSATKIKPKPPKRGFALD